MESAMLQELAQFGAAGLIGILWILERRHSNQRERELTEAHARLMQQREELSELILVVRDNVAAMTAVERGHDRLIALLEDGEEAERPAEQR